MDQVHVEAPVASARAASVEREFYSDFPLVLNYVARLVDDIDGGIGIACAAFRQVAIACAIAPPATGCGAPMCFGQRPSSAAKP